MSDQVEADKVPMTLKSWSTFQQGETSNVSMTFSIPTGTVFWGQQLMLVPQYRDVPLDDSEGSTVWRRAAWTTEQTTFPSDGGYGIAVDLMWRIAASVNGKTYDYQNAPCSVPLLYSYCPPCWGGGNGVAPSCPSGLVFDQEWYLPGGSSMAVTLTPTFTSRATAPAKYIYRIVGLLSGGKEVF